VSVAHIAFPRELLESTKLVKFERYAEFTVGRADRAQAPAAGHRVVDNRSVDREEH